MEHNSGLRVVRVNYRGIANSENENIDACRHKIKATRGLGVQWIYVQGYEDEKSARKMLAEQNWKVESTASVKAGRKVYFRCCKSRSECPCRMYILITPEIVSSFKNDSEHNHVQVKRSVLDIDMKNRINELLDLKLTPKQILSTLEDEGSTISYSQLSNYKQRRREKLYGPAKTKAAQLENWCKSKEGKPTEPDEVYVANRLIDIDDSGEIYIRIFLTTQRMLLNALKSKHISIDATYKLTYEGYPTIVVGTTDRDRKFFPVAIALCDRETETEYSFVFESLKNAIFQIHGKEYKPTILVADASPAITNGFNLQFDCLESRVYCWFHVYKAYTKELRSVKNAEVHNEINDDIHLLQVSISKGAFQAACTLWINKWKKHKLKAVRDFVTYFATNWISINSGWYEGHALFVPSTNNALEATNKVIKDEITFRERKPATEFLSLCYSAMHRWSKVMKEGEVNSKIFVTQPSVSTKLLAKGFTWFMKKNPIMSLDATTTLTVYYIPSSTSSGILTRTAIDNYRFEMTSYSWSTWKEYEKCATESWQIIHDSEDWKESTCTCPIYLKQYICKHTVAIAYINRQLIIPVAAKKIATGVKKRRGRPSLAKPALVRQ